jgi:hypothetical protein
MNCSIEYSLDGCKGHVRVEAEDSIAALLTWLETVPPTAGIKAIVRVLLPVEVVQ